MKLESTRILLTGATGGLGRELARQLSEAGATLVLAGRDQAKLDQLAQRLRNPAATVPADLDTAAGITAVTSAAREHKVNVLINNAGVGCFGLLEQQAWTDIERVLATNLVAPIALTHALLPWLKTQPEAAIVNIGSTFGSIPFAGFAAYSATKAGLRGFSQALRRELADAPVAVIHLAPRAIDTPLNSAAVNALNRALKNHSDTAQAVAQQVLAALRRGERERHFGFPERIFAWINSAAPALIDRALVGKLAVIKKHASRQSHS